MAVQCLILGASQLDSVPSAGPLRAWLQVKSQEADMEGGGPASAGCWCNVDVRGNTSSCILVQVWQGWPFTKAAHHQHMQ